MEKLMENRERLCRQKLRQLESQSQLLREQLEAERRRARDVLRDRQLSSEAGRLLGLGRGGFSTVGPHWTPSNDNIDSAGYRWEKSFFKLCKFELF